MIILWPLILQLFLPPAKEVWGKTMFYTCLWFCSLWGGGGCLCPGVSVWGGPCPGGLCPGRSLSRWVSVQGSLSRGVSVQGSLCPRGSLSRGLCPWGVSVLGGLCLGGLCPWGGLCHGDHHHTITSGWYASYWNAFLFYSYFLKNNWKKKEKFSKRVGRKTCVTYRGYRGSEIYYNARKQFICGSKDGFANDAFPGPISFILIQFSAKFNRLGHPLGL